MYYFESYFSRELYIQSLFVLSEKESVELAPKYFCHIYNRSNYYDVKGRETFENLSATQHKWTEFEG